MRHTSSYSLIKKYTSLDSRPWNFRRVLMNCGFNPKLLPLASGSRLQDGREVLMG